MSKYTPQPINTEGMQLPTELDSLSEAIAKNVHEVWARNRINEGWAHGEQRDDIKKTHPCLIPYEELPESEKEYDRWTSQETIKTILAMGWKVMKSD